MKQKIIQIGNSIGIILPSRLAQEVKFNKGEEIYVHCDAESKVLILSKREIDKNYSKKNARFVQLLDELNEQYGDAMRELAKK